MTTSSKVMLLITLAIVGGGIFLFTYQKPDTTPSQETGSTEKKGTDREGKRTASECHSEILELISDGQDSVCGISPDEAKKELDLRKDKVVEIDQITPLLGDLPLGIVVAISNASKNTAGIRPDQARQEILKRYAHINTEGKDLITFKDVLNFIQSFNQRKSSEQKEIDKWADNEDQELISKILKDAENNPKSFSNIFYALRNFDKLPDEATQYINRYLANVSPEEVNPEDLDDFNGIVSSLEKIKLSPNQKE